MKLTRHLRIAAGAVAVAAIATPTTVLTSLGGGGVASAASVSLSNPTNFDEIQYNQQTGNSGTYYSFVPWSGSTAPGAGKTTSQSMTGGGGCSPGPNFPGLPPNPLLNVTGQLFSQGFPNGVQVANVGAFKFRTGVCIGGSGNSQIITPNEALTFGVGSDTAVVGSNRAFIEAQIVIVRGDSNADAATAEMIESKGGTQVGAQQIRIPSGSANVIADTKCGTGVANSEASFAPCTGGAANLNGFDQVQLVFLGSANDSISIVPTSIFYLEQTICGGQTINSASGDNTVSGSITLGGASTFCKGYSLFQASSTDPTSDDGKSIDFVSDPNAAATVTASFDWGDVPYCRPDNAPNTGVAVCPDTQISFDQGATYQPQTYCAPAPAPMPAGVPWCTTSKSFSYEVVNNVTMTHIKETWRGTGDPFVRK